LHFCRFFSNLHFPGLDELQDGGGKRPSEGRTYDRQKNLIQNIFGTIILTMLPVEFSN
jgi:hypothetical protein